MVETHLITKNSTALTQQSRAYLFTRHITLETHTDRKNTPPEKRPQGLTGTIFQPTPHPHAHEAYTPLSQRIPHFHKLSTRKNANFTFSIGEPRESLLWRYPSSALPCARQLRAFFKCVFVVMVLYALVRAIHRYCAV